MSFFRPSLRLLESQLFSSLRKSVCFILFVSLSVWLSVCLCLRFQVFLFLSYYINLYIFAYVCIFISTLFPLYLFLIVCLSVCLSFHFWMSFCLQMVMRLFEWVSLVCVKQSLMHIKAEEGGYFDDDWQKNTSSFNNKKYSEFRFSDLKS